MKHTVQTLLVGLIAVMQPIAASALEIRTAAQDSQPKFIKDGETITGLCVDVFKAIERVDPELKFSELRDFMPLPRIEAWLEEGKLDAFCGLAKTDKRKAKLDFIETPIYATQSVLAARIDDKVDIKGFDDLAKLGDDGVVLVVNGTVHVDILAAHPSIKFDAGAKDTSTNLNKLIAGRGRFVFQNDFALADEIKRDHFVGKIKILPTQFELEGTERYFVVSKKATPGINDKLRAAVEKLSKSGELARIFLAYKPK
ncbi:substrate-binding periplasmic protein [Chitinimonas sp. BJB300]|nr:transporter substrate-binding domain-containing protein [Chitinimonas sp. BJB300]PHV13037.1 ABC transporter substrate-binding protein [Chitinimonas sp. BJB300]